MFLKHAVLIPTASFPKWTAVSENSFLTFYIPKSPVQLSSLPDISPCTLVCISVSILKICVVFFFFFNSQSVHILALSFQLIFMEV